MLDGTNKVICYSDACDIMTEENNEVGAVTEEKQNQIYAWKNKLRLQYDQQKKCIDYTKDYHSISYAKEVIKKEFGQDLHPDIIKELELLNKKYDDRERAKQIAAHNQNPDVIRERLIQEQIRATREQTEEIRKQTRAIEASAKQNAYRSTYY